MIKPNTANIYIVIQFFAPYYHLVSDALYIQTQWISTTVVKTGQFVSKLTEWYGDTL